MDILCKVLHDMRPSNFFFMVKIRFESPVRVAIRSSLGVKMEFQLYSGTQYLS